VTHLGNAVRRVRAANPSPLTGTGTNTYILGTGAVAVIDPGPALPDHLDAILSALTSGDRISHILVTHAHLDHSALAPALQAATGAQVLAFGDALSGRSALMTQLLDRGMTGGGEGADTAFRPDGTLADGDVVQGETWKIEAIHTPGHMGCHLAFGFGGVLFSGDHVMDWSSTLVSPPDGDMGAYMASLSRLAARDWQVFLPGHGEPVADPAARLAELAAHRRARETAILAALKDGPATPMALTQRIYTDTPAALLPAASRNVLAHLIDLVDRKEISATAFPGPAAHFHRP
jgi:glyoxylase-like metal-dependent hydrolase (beta-lactamase superfamily II)